MLNIHHLELFYFVARHGGIMPAVRNMPYGIQQPAVSGQILQLEDSLGGPLFQRRPFTLTPAGEQLYKFIKPFFDEIDSVADGIRGGAIQTVRLAASAIVLRDHLPALLPVLRERFPGLKLILKEGTQAQVTDWLAAGEIDLAVSVLDGKMPAAVQNRILLELPLQLLVPKSMKLRSAEAILSQDRIPQTLISFPGNETMARLFQSELTRRKVAWPVGMEVNSVELVDIYASNGFGIGLTVKVPGKKTPANVHAITLDDFPPVAVAALWQNQLSAVGLALVEIFDRHAAAITAPA
ncbi:MAG: LysR family transcriptional regulator [Verrucomicrobiae bacterium]|jgi:DNA-binding transcriptional LysR family regulator|nr:LysR family transcriptional regulator [Verrucomicrobiae bacterium]